MLDINHENSYASIKPSRRCLLISAAVFALLGAAALACDMPLARFCHELRVDGRWPGDLVRLFSMSEVFGHGLGVFFILLSVFVLDPGHRRALVRVAVATYGAGMSANLVKLCIARWRPHSFDWSKGSVWDTFCGFMTFGDGGSRMQGFPSAHSATAVGLAVALTWLYPRGRWLFTLFAVLVACQRMESGAHFPSDVLFGAALGFIVSAICIHYVRWFDRFEGRN